MGWALPPCIPKEFHPDPAPTTHSGALWDADPSVASGKPGDLSRPFLPISDLPSTHEGSLACLEQEHHYSSKKATVVRLSPQLTCQANSLAGLRNLIILTRIPEAPLIFQNTFYISY